MRIAINALVDLSVDDGAKIYLRSLTRALLGVPSMEFVVLVGRGQSVNLCAALKPQSVELDIPVRRSFEQILHQPKIKDFLKAEGVDIYHIPNSLPVFHMDVATCVTIHDLVDLRFPKYGFIRTHYREYFNKLAARRASRVITVSENSKVDIQRLLGVPSEKIHVIPCGVDEMFLPLDHLECKTITQKAFGVPDEFLLAPGGFEANKNVLRTLQAFSQIVEAGFPHSLVLTGKANSRMERALRRETARLGLNGRVFITGQIPYQQMPILYNAATLVVYPTLYEGFGLPVLEAMACGVPLVTSAVASIPEVAGESAAFADPMRPSEISNAIINLLQSDKARRNLVLSGLSRARNFTWKKTAMETARVFEIAAMGSSGRGCTDSADSRPKECLPVHVEEK